MADGIRPGQVPDWRPGAEFWKPLADGREVTIYPLLHGKGRLCVGPLADPNGYDIAYRYESVAAAIKAAEGWDGEETENPPDFEEIEFGKDRHPGTLSNPTENPIPEIGDFVAPSQNDEIRMETDPASASEYIQLTRVLNDGRQVTILGEKKVRTDGLILVAVEQVNLTPAPHHMVGKRGGADAARAISVDLQQWSQKHPAPGADKSKTAIEDENRELMKRLIHRDADQGR